MEEGPGFPFFLPKGMILKNTLVDYWRKLHEREGYQEISTPILLNRKLWETSGHWDHYRENMYTTTIDEEEFAVKPMNCPGGMLVYKSQPRSYRDLPLRMGELGLVHRHEKSGQLHGLMRVRCFTQDLSLIHILSQKRAIGAMPIAGSYRSIDFSLSNMSNSHIQKVGVFTQYNARSLKDVYKRQVSWFRVSIRYATYLLILQLMYQSLSRSSGV